MKQKELEEIAGLLKEATIKDDEVFTYKPHSITCRYGGSDWGLTTRLPKDKLKEVLKIINE